MAVIKARTEFASALNQICAEHGIELDVVLDSIKEALLAAYRRDFGTDEEIEYEAEIKPETGETHIFLVKGKGRKEVTPPDFGRIAAQVAKQVLIQKIREAEKSSVLEEYSGRIGSLVNGRIIRFDGPNIIVDVDRAEAFLQKRNKLWQKIIKLGNVLLFTLKELKILVKANR